ncbi:MAG: ferrochelatase [Pseudomonadales bacterium]
MSIRSITPLEQKQPSPSISVEVPLKVGVVIVNSGTPTQPTFVGVWKFLKALLSDPRVVEIPRPLWWPILNLVILPLRTPRMVKAYKAIWDNGDSPLRLITAQQAEKLQQKLTRQFPANSPKVVYAMNYCGPVLDDVVQRLEREGYGYIIVLPLYPQYCAAVTGSVYDSVADIIRRRRDIPHLHVIKQYYQSPHYLDALANKVQAHWHQHGKAEKLLLSFHSLPQRYIDLGDPYYHQCKQTAECLAQRLQLADTQWQLSFQSRFITGKWVQPYTSVTLAEWGQNGVKSVDVFCPAFAADCLETVEEIDKENRERFLSAGGKTYHMIPCLNADDDHIVMMGMVVEQYMPRVAMQADPD